MANGAFIENMSGGAREGLVHTVGDGKITVMSFYYLTPGSLRLSVCCACLPDALQMSSYILEEENFEWNSNLVVLLLVNSLNSNFC